MIFCISLLGWLQARRHYDTQNLHAFIQSGRISSWIDKVNWLNSCRIIHKLVWNSSSGLQGGHTHGKIFYH